MYFSTKVFSSVLLAAAMAATSVVADDHAKSPLGKDPKVDGSPAQLTDLAAGANGVCAFSRTTLPPVTRTEVVLETDMATVVQCEVTTTTTSTVCSTTTICENTPTGNPIEGKTTCTTDKDKHSEPTPESYDDIVAAGSGQVGPDGPARPAGANSGSSGSDSESDSEEPTITPAARRFRA